MLGRLLTITLALAVLLAGSRCWCAGMPSTDHRSCCAGKCPAKHHPSPAEGRLCGHCAGTLVAGTADAAAPLDLHKTLWQPPMLPSQVIADAADHSHLLLPIDHPPPPASTLRALHVLFTI